MNKDKILVGALVIVIAILVMAIGFVIASRQISRYAQEDCMDKLEDNTRDITKDFAERFQRDMDGMVTFTALAINDIQSEETLRKILTDYCAQRRISGLHIIWQDGREIVVGNVPHNHEYGGKKLFEEEAAKVPYVSEVIRNGGMRSEQYVYKAAPIYDENHNIKAIVHGSIPLDILAEYVSTNLYDGKLIISMIEGKSGVYMINELHRYDENGKERPLQNLNTVRHITPVDGYSYEKMLEDHKEGREGYWAFKNKKTGFISHSSYMPVGINDWSMAVTVQDAVAFGTYAHIRSVVICLSVIFLAGILVIIYALLSLYRRRKLVYEEMIARANVANQAKTDFLSRMSHDIRTPMNAIIGYTDLARKHLEDKELTKDYFEKISVSSHHLLALINDVLEMSRIESGKVTLSESEERLPDMMHELRTIFQSEMAAKSLEFCMDASEVKNETILCDKLRLNQILINLVGNAVKFTNPGGKIGVRIHQIDDAEAGFAHYEFRVTDTGIGISEKFLAHLFNPFERESTDKVNKIQGIGLGLSITKNLVEMMGGRIRVESKVGEGSEFILDLTFKIVAEEVPSKKEIPQLEGLQALVVDDDANTCFSVSRMLGEIGMHAEWTTSGREAVLRVQYAKECKESFAVYIIDLLIPDMNGIEVVRRIRREIGNDAPIVILTAYDWSEFEAEARDAGVTAFCSKPLFMSELLTALRCTSDVKPEPVPTLPDDIRFDGKRVLLTEDNAMNAEIATMILTDSGFEVEVARNGEQAVDAVRTHPAGYYDIALMDLQMPVMNGLEATRRIKALEDEEKRKLNIIAMTANAFEEDVRNCLDAGMCAHISKPIDADEMLSLLAQYCFSAKTNAVKK